MKKKTLASLAVLAAALMLSSCSTPKASSNSFSSAEVFSSTASSSSVIAQSSSASNSSAASSSAVNSIVSSTSSDSSSATASSSTVSSSPSSSSLVSSTTASSSPTSAFGGYYNSIDFTQTRANLKTALFHLINPHTVRGYSALWTAYQTTDIDENGKIWDMYSKYRWTYGKKDASGAGGDQCGSYSVEGDCYNREHTIPKSVFNEATPMVCDVHHIFPTDGKVNGIRSDYPHGKVAKATYISTNGTLIGSSDTTTGYSGTVCELPDEYKGDFARAYFYFVTCYEDKIPSYSFPAFSKNTYPSLASWAQKLYVQWATNDPVSEKEIKRNQAAYVFQGNRNPFVDHPEAVSAIWGN